MSKARKDSVESMKLVNNKKYYTLEESATLAGVSVRTLRRWISAGRLSDFLYPFRASPSELLYRLEAPGEGDVRNEKGEWIIPAETGVTEGGGAGEGISST